MSYKIKETADMAGISVRTLHHYDEIGLLKPEFVTPAGYRLYTDHDIEKLQQILFFKELDFSLQEIKIIIESPDFNRIEALKMHKKLLIEKSQRLLKIIESVDKTINSIEGGAKMDNKEMLNVFDTNEIEEHKKKYEEETRLKYGGTKAYTESEEKASKYSKNDWARITTNMNEIFCRLSELMEKEVSSQEVQEVVEQWRQHITENFYDCTPDIFRGLADLYVCDERFTANIDKIKPGLANFLSEAIKFYCKKL